MSQLAPINPQAPVTVTPLPDAELSAPVTLEDGHASAPPVGYDEVETVQSFASGNTFRTGMLLYQARNAETGDWELRMLSAEADARHVPDMLVFTSNRKLERTDFGQQGPVWQAVLETKALMEDEANIVPPEGRQIGGIGDFAAGATFGWVMDLVGTVANLPEAAVRAVGFTLALPAAIAERIEDAIRPGDQTRTGLDNPLNNENYLQFGDVQNTHTTRAVDRLEQGLASYLNANRSSHAYSLGQMIGPYLFRTGKASGSSSAARLPGEFSAQNVTAAARSASPREIHNGLSRVSDAALQGGFAANPGVKSAIVARLRQFPSDPAAQAALNRIDTVTGPTPVRTRPVQTAPVPTATQTPVTTPPVSTAAPAAARANSAITTVSPQEQTLRPTVAPEPPPQQQNVETLERISSASVEELDAWYGSMSVEQIAALPAEVQEAVAGAISRAMSDHLSSLPQTEASMIPPEQLADLNRQTILDYASDRGRAEALRDAVMQSEMTEVAQQLSNEGYYVMALFDSGNGGIAASKVFANMIDTMTNADVRLIVMGDHQMQPYGSKAPGQIAVVVKNGMLAARNARPDVTPFACNTACTAIEAMERSNPGLTGELAVEDLIMNTARVVANPRNEPFFGKRPMILSTQATKDSGMYSDLITAFSGGEVQPYGLGASDAPGPEGVRDLATLVNQLAHLNPKRAGEVQAAVDHYVDQMPEDITSVVLCCTHYPELTSQIRKALDDRRGMTHVPIINPMADQVVISMQRLVSEGVRPRLDDPDGRGGSVAVSSVINSLTDEQLAAAEAEYYGTETPTETLGEFLESRQREKRGAFLDFYDSVPALTERNWPAFTGKVFDSAFYMDRISDYISGRISAVDVALMGFNGRNLHTFFNTNGADFSNPNGVAARNGATNAAMAMNQADTVLIGTGFNVPPPGTLAPDARPTEGAPETDGPLGAAAQTRTLLTLGKDVHLVGDQANIDVLRASLGALGVDVDNTENLTFHVFDSKGTQAHQDARDLLAEVKPDVVQMIEVPGRNRPRTGVVQADDGSRTNMGNINIDGINVDLDAIMLEAKVAENADLWGGKEITTIGIGDGGNEAGMGDLSLDGISIRHPSIVPSDIVVTAENSNLGGYAVTAELARLNEALDQPGMLLMPEERAAMLDAAIEAGAVDGVARENIDQEPRVDGFSNRYHERLLTNLNNAVRGEWPDR